MNFLNIIISILTRAGFVNSAAMAEILALALVGRVNPMLFGPGGHGKSQMVERVLSTIIGALTRTLSCGEGLSEARLFGGLDFKALESEGLERFHAENSFLSWDFAVFEEILDAPSVVLLSLKDTLTSKALRSGSQLVPMRTQVLLGLTNKEPGEVAEEGPAVQALMERFPLQLRVAWEDYSAGAFKTLFAAQADKRDSNMSITFEEIKTLQNKVEGVSIASRMDALLAQLLAGQIERGVIVSPRTAMFARRILATSAVIRGRDHVTEEDFISLRFLPGCEDIASTIEADIKAAREKSVAQDTMAAIEWKIAELDLSSTRPIKLLQAAKIGMEIENQLSGLKVPDELVERRNGLRTHIAEVIKNAQKRALEYTHN